MEFFEKHRFDELFYEADQYINDKRYADAMQQLEAILAEAPQYGKAYNHLAWLYETKYRDYGRAEAYYKKCIEFEPGYTPAYLNLAAVLSSMNKYDDLEKLLQQAMDVPGINKATVNNEFGIMYELKGDYTKAVEHYKLAILFTLSDANIDTYQASINRCRKKEQILKM